MPAVGRGWTDEQMRALTAYARQVARRANGG
jgi:hypothetical protein